MHWQGWLISGVAAGPLAVWCLSRAARAHTATGETPGPITWLGVLLMGGAMVLAPGVPLVQTGALALLVLAAGIMRQLRQDLSQGKAAPVPLRAVPGALPLQVPGARPLPDRHVPARPTVAGS